MPVYFGNKIKTERKRCGLTQKQLADKLGVKNTTVSNWEKDLNRPDADMVELLCGIFGITVGELYGGPAEPSSAAPDILDELDVAFLGDYGELTEENKATLRDMARLMLKNQGGGKE